MGIPFTLRHYYVYIYLHEYKRTKTCTIQKDMSKLMIVTKNASQVSSVTCLSDVKCQLNK